jgi:L-ribulokinase
MTGLKARVFQPNPQAHEVYTQLYALYRNLHDAFGTPHNSGNLYGVMKSLIEIRNQARR